MENIQTDFANKHVADCRVCSQEEAARVQASVHDGPDLSVARRITMYTCVVLHIVLTLCVWVLDVAWVISCNVLVVGFARVRGTCASFELHTRNTSLLHLP